MDHRNCPHEEEPETIQDAWERAMRDYFLGLAILTFVQRQKAVIIFQRLFGYDNLATPKAFEKFIFYVDLFKMEAIQYDDNKIMFSPAAICKLNDMEVIWENIINE